MSGGGCSLLWPRLSLVLLAILALPATADMRLERLKFDEKIDSDGKSESSRERTDVVFVGKNSVRLDTGSDSTIVRLDDGVYLYLDHAAKAYAEIALPLKLEDLLTKREKACLSQLPQALENTEAIVELTDERRMIDGREARRLRTAWRHFGGLEFEGDTWITHSLVVDLEPYWVMVRNRRAVSPVYRGWVDNVAEIGGYPVESTTTMRSDRGVKVARQRLVAVSEVKADKSRYLPPADYSPTLDRPPLDVACLGTPTQ